MTARPGWPAVSGAATFLDIRRAVESEVAHAADGSIRAGVYPTHTNAIVSAKATMAVDVGAFVAALNRNGLVRVANDGTVTVSISAAPGSGSRWSVVYVKQLETAAPMSDGSDGPVIDKVESTTSESAARALLPVGALELAVVQVPAGASATNSVGVIITQKAPYTSVLGGKVLARNDVELQAWAPINGSTAYRLDTGVTYLRSGGAWKAWESDFINYTPASDAFNANVTKIRRYRYVDGKIECEHVSTVNAFGNIVGDAAVSLPVDAAPLSNGYQQFENLTGSAWDLSATTNHMFLVEANINSVSSVLYALGASSITGFVTSSAPFALDSGDVYRAVFRYTPA